MIEPMTTRTTTQTMSVKLMRVIYLPDAQAIAGAQASGTFLQNYTDFYQNGSIKSGTFSHQISSALILILEKSQLLIKIFLDIHYFHHTLSG